jgi:hypothetical protein
MTKFIISINEKKNGKDPHGFMKPNLLSLKQIMS